MRCRTIFFAIHFSAIEGHGGNLIPRPPFVPTSYLIITPPPINMTVIAKVTTSPTITQKGLLY